VVAWMRKASEGFSEGLLLDEGGLLREWGLLNQVLTVPHVSIQ